MSAEYLSTGRPPWAVTAWVDDSYVYIELPCKDGPPYIEKHAFSESGLSKALGMMRDLYRKQRPKGGTYSLSRHPKLIAMDKSKGLPQASDSQRTIVRNILKKRGII